MHNPSHRKPNTENPRTQVESWRDLEIWQFAHKAVLIIYRLTERFPAVERFRLTDQLCRAAASVPANIAEGKGRSSLKEYLQFLAIARGSVEEVKYFLLLSRDLKYMQEEDYQGINGDYDRVGKMLNGLMTSLRHHLKPKT
jgi:four helix bundle protein